MNAASRRPLLLQRFRGRSARRWACGLIAAVSLTGCSRQFWRQQADRDVYDAVGERLDDPRWAVPRVDITPDPRSRFFDPYNPDKPPLPPDDPRAHCYMHWVDGWEGYKGWHQFGDLMSVENPQWLAPFGLSSNMIDPETGQYVGQLPAIENLTLDGAVELAQIHSRQYQTQLENLYLAALDVTFQRFQFGVRYLGAFGEPGAAFTSRITPDGIDVNDGVSGSSEFGVSQLLPTGAQWAVEFTNNTLWLFSGGNQTSSASVLSYSLTQPLWQGAGRKVVMEALTLAERQLLYAARDLARFRQELFTNVVADAGAISFLGLLQTRQQILNQEANLMRLQDQMYALMSNAERGRLFSSAALPAVFNPADPDIPETPAYLLNLPPELQGLLIYDPFDQRLRWRAVQQPGRQEGMMAADDLMTLEQATLLQQLNDDPAYQEAIQSLIRQVRNPVTSLDVLQILTNYNNAQNQLRNAERSYQDNLDAYKILLGLPPTIPVTLDTSLLKQFELIDPILQSLEKEADTGFSAIWGSAIPALALGADPDEPLPPLDPDRVRNVADQFDGLVRRVRSEILDLIEDEIEIVRDLIPGRLLELEPEEQERLETDFERDQRIFDGARRDFELIESQIDDFREQLRAARFEPGRLQDIQRNIKFLQEDLVRTIRTLTVIQVGLRAEMIELNDFDMTEEVCIAQAMSNRVDLMNARGAVMDARRQVEVAANRLQASMALIAEGNFGTSDPNNPFSFNGDNSQIRFGVRFKAPLDQIAERNNYRAVLINYQRQKRTYMLFEDTVKQEVRRALRGLIVQRRNLETSRGAIRRAALQYDATNEQTNDPARAAQTANTGGLQGQNVLQALNSILNAQNQLLSNWIDYERNRLNIYRDMGTMEIGPDGLWDDPFYRDTSNASNRPQTPFVVPPAPAAPGDSGDGWGRDGDGLGAPELGPLPF
ncbi:MAG: TolC family protein [Planctomyces sp.]|nr:TolC family protein [Planctomyces sp.]